MTTPVRGSFEYVNADWGDVGDPQPQTLQAMRDPAATNAYGTVHLTHAQVPRYEAYPGGAPFPMWWFGLLMGTIAWTIYDGAKTHWGVSKLPSGYLWVMDVLLAVAVVGMLLDTIVTAHGTYVGHGRSFGTEANGYLRQWGAWLSENVGLNFAQSLLLTDVIEGAILLSAWYYSRKERNAWGLISLFTLGGAHLFMGWFSWNKTFMETMAMVPQVLQQLTGQVPRLAHQGAGPQYVIGVV